MKKPQDNRQDRHRQYAIVPDPTEILWDLNLFWKRSDSFIDKII